MARTRTTPEAKWLANELAALAGELISIDAQLERLAKRRAEVLEAQGSLARVAEMVGATVAVAGELAPVNARRYGNRGSFKATVAELLKEAAPQHMDTVSVAVALAGRLGVPLASRDELVLFVRERVRHILKMLAKEGVVEKVNEKGVRHPNQMGLWRWRGEQGRLPTLAALHGQVGEAL